MRVPEGVAKGKALVTLSFPDWHGDKVAVTRYEIPVADGDYRLLARRATLERGIEPNTQLSDVLSFLSDRYDLRIVIDEEAFKKAKVDSVARLPVELPVLEQVIMASVLSKLVQQVGATYEVRGRGIYIVPSKDAGR